MQTQGFYDKYKSVYYQFGPEKTITLAFCELFTAHCLEVKKSGIPGDPVHRYRFKQDAPSTMLHRVERIVAESLGTFKSFPTMLDETVPKVKKFYKVASRSPIERLSNIEKKDPVDSNQQFNALLGEAIERNAISYEVQPAGC